MGHNFFFSPLGNVEADLGLLNVEVLGATPFEPKIPDDGDYSGVYSLLATLSPSAKQGVITGTKAVVKGIKAKLIKDGKHIEAIVSVDIDNALKLSQDVYWDTDDSAAGRLVEGAGGCGSTSRPTRRACALRASSRHLAD